MMARNSCSVSLLLGVFMLAGLVAEAQASAYLLGPDGRPVINKRGQCFRTVEWRPDLAIKECDPLFWQIAQAKKRKLQKEAAAGAAGTAAGTAPSAAHSGATPPVETAAATAAASGPSISATQPSFEYVELQPLVLNTDTSFRFGDFHLTPEGKDALQTLAGLLEARRAEDLKIHIVGHTDRVGSEKANMALGLKRAEAVKAALVEMGLEAASIEVESRGSSQPVTQRENCPDTLVKCELVDCLRPDRRVVVLTRAKVGVRRKLTDGQDE
jgi:OOP family OmpA-OmpF porin